MPVSVLLRFLKTATSQTSSLFPAILEHGRLVDSSPIPSFNMFVHAQKNTPDETG